MTGNNKRCQAFEKMKLAIVALPIAQSSALLSATLKTDFFEKCPFVLNRGVCGKLQSHWHLIENKSKSSLVDVGGKDKVGCCNMTTFALNAVSSINALIQNISGSEEGISMAYEFFGIDRLETISKHIITIQYPTLLILETEELKRLN